MEDHHEMMMNLLKHVVTTKPGFDEIYAWINKELGRLNSLSETTMEVSDHNTKMRECFKEIDELKAAMGNVRELKLNGLAIASCNVDLKTEIARLKEQVRIDNLILKVERVRNEKPVVWVRNDGDSPYNWRRCDEAGKPYDTWGRSYQAYEHLYRDIATVKVWEEPDCDCVKTEWNQYRNVIQLSQPILNGNVRGVRPMTDTINDLQKECHRIATDHGFWEPPIDERCIECDHFKAAKIALMHTELSEAIECVRYPDQASETIGVELADTVIRILDFAGKYDLDLADAIKKKMEKNRGRKWKHGKRI